jgi:hypothetical protein
MVAGGLEDFGQCHALVVEGRPQQRHTGLVRVQARQQRRAGGAAAGRVVELGVAQPVTRQRIDIGRADLAAVAADVGPPQVVREDDEDVGPLIGVPSRRGLGGEHLGMGPGLGDRQPVQSDQDDQPQHNGHQASLGRGSFWHFLYSLLYPPPQFVLAKFVSCVALGSFWQNSLSHGF